MTKKLDKSKVAGYKNARKMLKNPEGNRQGPRLVKARR